MHKTCCLLWETLGAEKLEVMSHLQCSREAIHCLPALQGIWLPVLCAFSSGWKGSSKACCVWEWQPLGVGDEMLREEKKKVVEG